MVSKGLVNGMIWFGKLRCLLEVTHVDRMVRGLGAARFDSGGCVSQC
jgi:hypothetical protein